MTVDEAKAFKMPHGLHKDKKLSEVPFPYLKWIAKNWLWKQLRDAAILVVNERAKDVGVKEDFKPTFTPKSFVRQKPKEFVSEPIGSLKELLDKAPEGLF